MKANEKVQALLYLSFSEGSGAKTGDASGNLPKVGIEYRRLNPKFTGKIDPKWRDGSLLFDGCSTAIACPPERITLQGGALAIRNYCGLYYRSPHRRGLCMAEADE